MKYLKLLLSYVHNIFVSKEMPNGPKVGKQLHVLQEIWLPFLIPCDV
jgi:hypothetical protein